MSYDLWKVDIDEDMNISTIDGSTPFYCYLLYPVGIIQR